MYLRTIDKKNDYFKRIGADIADDNKVKLPFFLGSQDKIKDDDRDAMHGYVFQYANDNVDIGSSGTKLETDAYSFALYDTKLRDDHVFTDALIGVSLLDIDQKRVIYGNILEGNREGQQIYGSFNFGKRIVDEDLNLNPGIKLDLGNYQNNIGLGLTVQPNTTLFIQYRVGGGADTNVGVNTITTVGQVGMNLNGPDAQTNAIVQGSLTVKNITPAIGGGDAPSIEALRNYISYNFAAQNRAVTLQDYKAVLLAMPPKFGTPAKASVTQVQNKINVGILSTDSDGNLSDLVSTVVLQNVANYLSNYRMMNDYISIFSAEVIDLSVDVAIVLDSAQNSGQVIADVVDKISTYFNPQIRQLGQNVYLSEIKSIVQNQNGVLTVANLNVYNNVGGQYSSAETSMQYSDPETKEIAPVDDTIFAQPSQVYQIRYPGKDIRVSVKNFQSITFS